MMIHYIYATTMIAGGWPRGMLNVRFAFAELWWLRKSVLSGVDLDKTKGYCVWADWAIASSRGHGNQNEEEEKLRPSMPPEKRRNMLVLQRQKLRRGLCGGGKVVFR